MKVVILCGGKGTRMGPYARYLPKPLHKIGDKPILWHIMKYYSVFGFKDFILCLGHQGQKIRQYFQAGHRRWKIKFVETGQETSKAERIKRIQSSITDENFFVAYGDDLSNVNLHKLLTYHFQHKRIVTLTAVNPYSQFGILKLNKQGVITNFKEKPRLGHWINGGFFVFNQKIFHCLRPNQELEKDVFRALARKEEIIAYRHQGFWECMNTYKDRLQLNELWEKKQAPWAIWRK